jgi:hypothetical protein
MGSKIIFPRLPYMNKTEFQTRIDYEKGLC